MLCYITGKTLPSFSGHCFVSFGSTDWMWAHPKYYNMPEPSPLALVLNKTCSYKPSPIEEKGGCCCAALKISFSGISHVIIYILGSPDSVHFGGQENRVNQQIQFWKSSFLHEIMILSCGKLYYPVQKPIHNALKYYWIKIFQ